eukprot:scaffold28108_cov61-Phaeocystis_antarctica.AAC.2
MAPSPWSCGTVPSAATVARIVVPAASTESCSVEVKEPSCAASVLVFAIGGTGPTERCPSNPCTSDWLNGSDSTRMLWKCICRDLFPAVRYAMTATRSDGASARSSWSAS